MVLRCYYFHALSIDKGICAYTNVYIQESGNISVCNYLYLYLAKYEFILTYTNVTHTTLIIVASSLCLSVTSQSNNESPGSTCLPPNHLIVQFLYICTVVSEFIFCTSTWNNFMCYSIVPVYIFSCL